MSLPSIAEDFALAREMLEATAVISGFDAERARAFAPRANHVFLTGEGSSRIFPAKHTSVSLLRQGVANLPVTAGAREALEYDLTDYHVYLASNSGRTAEAVSLAERGTCRHTTAITAVEASVLEQQTDDAYVLNCGSEDAVAATKSVIAQGLFYDAALGAADLTPASLSSLAQAVQQTLTAAVPSELIELAVGSSPIYFAGRADGVAEELTLKTNEITRVPADFLEGTYALHGIEEVMRGDGLVVLVEPFPQDEARFYDVLVQGVGIPVVALSTRETRFPTFVLPECAGFQAYVSLAAGWNFLAHAGAALGLDLDKPERARKIGNEVQ